MSQHHRQNSPRGFIYADQHLFPDAQQWLVPANLAARRASGRSGSVGGRDGGPVRSEPARQGLPSRPGTARRSKARACKWVRFASSGSLRKQPQEQKGASALCEGWVRGLARAIQKGTRAPSLRCVAKELDKAVRKAWLAKRSVRVVLCSLHVSALAQHRR